MKKLFFVAVITGCLFFENVFSQNVGINITGATPSDPRAMLEVRKAGFSKLKVRSENFGDTSVLEFSNRNAGNLGTDLLFSLNREEGLLLSSLSDLSGNTKDSLLSLRINSGHLGIGIKNPVYPLQLHTPSSATSYMSFTNNTTGVNAFSGLLVGISGNSAIVTNLENGNLRLGTNNLTRVMIDGSGNVGVGNLSPAYKLDINGDLNLTGAMRINGSAGTAGQVLSSNGASDPQWKSTAFSNNVRFGARFTAVDAGDEDIFPLYYNLSPADVSITTFTDFITINKTGLYRFQGTWSALLQGSGISGLPELNLFITLTGSTSLSYSMATFKQLEPRSNSVTSYNHRDDFSIDIYIVAPTTLQFGRNFVTSGGSITHREIVADLFGYLIAE